MSILNKTIMLRRLGTAKDPSINDTPQTSEPSDGRRLSKLTRQGSFIFVLRTLALLLFIWQAPQFHGNGLTLAALLGCNIAAHSLTVSVYGRGGISVGFVVTLAVIVQFGA